MALLVAGAASWNASIALEEDETDVDAEVAGAVLELPRARASAGKAWLWRLAVASTALLGAGGVLAVCGRQRHSLAPETQGVSAELSQEWSSGGSPEGSDGTGRRCYSTVPGAGPVIQVLHDNSSVCARFTDLKGSLRGIEPGTTVWYVTESMHVCDSMKQQPEKWGDMQCCTPDLCNGGPTSCLAGASGGVAAVSMADDPMSVCAKYMYKGLMLHVPMTMESCSALKKTPDEYGDVLCCSTDLCNGNGDASLGYSVSQDQFRDMGFGKCLANGRDPTYRFLGPVGQYGCSTRCAASDSCYGFSVSNFGSCLHWLERGLTGGGAIWGGAHCYVKSTATKSTATAAFRDAGFGRCVSMPNLHEPRYEYFQGVGDSECRRRCMENDSCHAYSESRYSNCINWQERGLTGNGVNWGQAHCLVKEQEQPSFKCLAGAADKLVEVDMAEFPLGACARITSLGSTTHVPLQHATCEMMKRSPEVYGDVQCCTTDLCTAPNASLPRRAA
mmetsp:Transcript_78/g.208  ORF Transcript_78/g.208 Transcript_78/m.208 type:complete len:502 (-) Transcript_78:226-1731(-)